MFVADVDVSAMSSCVALSFIIVQIAATNRYVKGATAKKSVAAYKVHWTLM